MGGAGRSDRHEGTPQGTSHMAPMAAQPSKAMAMGPSRTHRARNTTVARRRWVILDLSIMNPPGRVKDSRTSRGGVIACLTALALAVIAWPSLSEGHAVLVRSVPAGGAMLTRPPERVDLRFNERLEAAFSTVSVWSAAGVQVDHRDVAVSSDDPRRLSVTLGRLEPGTYTVRFRVLSVDGHISESSFPFTVRAKP